MKKIILYILFIISSISFSQEIKFGKVSKEELQEKYYPLDSIASASYLYKKRRTYYEYINQEGFLIITDFHERIKIYNKEGLEKANKYISYYTPNTGKQEKISSIRGFSFNLVNGKIEKQKLSNASIFDEEVSKFRSSKKLTFPNVNEGTVIDLKYTLVSPYSTSIDDIEFQFDIPVKKLKYQIEIPEYYIFNKRSKGYYFITPKEKKKSGKLKYKYSERGTFNKKTTYSGEKEYQININIFDETNIPALKDDEPYVTNIKNYRGGLKYELAQTNFISIGGNIKNYSTSWSDVSKQIYNSSGFGSQLDKTNYYKIELPSIIANCSNETEKIIAIFQFVKSKVSWNNYNGIYTDAGVKKAFKEGTGNVADINLMLTSMLREAGINANPVLVSTRANGVPLFPTIEGFNYVISMVELTNNTYMLLDATDPFSFPNILPIRTLNWNGRKITKQGSSWVNLTPNKLAEETNIINVKVSEDGSISGILRAKYGNLNALIFRNSYNHLSDEALINKLEEKHSIEIENYKISNKKNISKPISESAKFFSENLVEEINDKLYINPLLFLTKKRNPFKSDERKFPVDFASPWKNTNIISIQIPDGYKVEAIPETLALGIPEQLGVFKFKTSVDGNKIKIQSVLQIETASVPSQYYIYLKEFYRKIIAKQNEKIILSR